VLTALLRRAIDEKENGKKENPAASLQNLVQLELVRP
jgi:hypothetical protein